MGDPIEIDLQRLTKILSGQFGTFGCLWMRTS